MKSKALLLSVGFTVFLVVVGALAPWIAPYPAGKLDLSAELASPNAHHLLGAGENGVDVLSHLIFGARISLWVGVFTVLVSATVGATLGGVAGYFGGLFDTLLMRVVDVLLAFPGILLSIFITAVLGPSLFHVVLALSLTGWTGHARLIRAQFLTLRNREFALAAQVLGASHTRILLRHLLPNAAGPLLVQATAALPGVILAEASLSFLGLGVPPGTPSWGALVDQGMQYLLIAPHVALFPGLALALTVLAFNFLGDGLRDMLDVKGAHP